MKIALCSPELWGSSCTQSPEGISVIIARNGPTPYGAMAQVRARMCPAAGKGKFLDCSPTPDRD
jgi:hypothetical protein